jgi:hypothetical protein
MTRLKPVPATRHANPGTFVHKDLHTCTHVFLRQDAHRLALEPPYSGPYRVLSRREKTLRLLERGKTVSVHRQGQTGLHPQRDRHINFRRKLCGHTTNPLCSTGYAIHLVFTTSTYPYYTFRSTCPFPRALQPLGHTPRGGVMWEPPT